MVCIQYIYGESHMQLGIPKVPTRVNYSISIATPQGPYISLLAFGICIVHLGKELGTPLVSIWVIHNNSFATT